MEWVLDVYMYNLNTRIRPISRRDHLPGLEGPPRSRDEAHSPTSYKTKKEKVAKERNKNRQKYTRYPPPRLEGYLLNSSNSCLFLPLLSRTQRTRLPRGLPPPAFHTTYPRSHHLHKSSPPFRIETKLGGR